MDRLTAFQNKVLDLVRKVPKGKVTTYKIIANKINHPRAYQAIGSALHNNPCIGDIPCHRVIKSNRVIGGYVNGKRKKVQLLLGEGLAMDPKKKKIISQRQIFKF